MQQAPATPKAKRWWNLISARFGALKAGHGHALQHSEKLALELRQNPRQRTSRAEQVVFLIPLVRRTHVGNWSRVEENLNKTLRCFLRQSNPNWIAIICGQDRPSLPNDERMYFLPFTEPVEGNDKWGKLGKLVEHFPKVARPSGYVMTFDADDLTHRDLVSRFLTIQHDNGYVIDHGLVHDIAAAAYGQAGKPTPLSPLRKPFWKLCGSCAAFRYDPNEPRLFRDFLVALCQHEHRMFPYLARLSGRPLLAVLDNLVMYEVNHGENFDRRLNQGDFKLRFVKRFPVNDEDRLRDIEESFF